jgi:hypothetical protein
MRYNKPLGVASVESITYPACVIASLWSHCERSEAIDRCVIASAAKQSLRTDKLSLRLLHCVRNDT